MKLIPVGKLRLILLLGLVLAGAGIVVLRTKPSFVPIRSSVQFLPADSRIPAQPVSWFDRWVPIRWSWLWRWRDRIRGPLATILIDARIFDCTDLSEQGMADLLAEPALGETNGLRGWVLDGVTLTGLKRKLEQGGARELTHPRVQTAHAIQSSMSVGNTVPVAGIPVQVGLVLDLLPLIQPDGTDLMAIFRMTEVMANPSIATGTPLSTEQAETMAASFVTNLATATRWKLPDGSGLFMLNSRRSNETRRIGVILTGTVQRPQ